MAGSLLKPYGLCYVAVLFRNKFNFNFNHNIGYFQITTTFSWHADKMYVHHNFTNIKVII